MKSVALVRRFLEPPFFVTVKAWFKFKCKVSPRAEVEITPYLSIGKGSVISSFCKVKASDGPLRIGANVSIATN